MFIIIYDTCIKFASKKVTKLHSAITDLILKFYQFTEIVVPSFIIFGVHKQKACYTIVYM